MACGHALDLPSSPEMPGVDFRAAGPHLTRMKKHRARTPAPTLPMTMAWLTLTSWETVCRRSLMMLQGTCPQAEYRRMVSEKRAAMQRSALVLMKGGGHAAQLAPFLRRTKANVKRLRRKA